MDWHKNFFNDIKKNSYTREVHDGFDPLFDFLFNQLDQVLEQLENSDNEFDKARYNDYKSILDDWQGYEERIKKRRETHFGYPLHLSKRSFLVDFFRIFEAFDVVLNNFGDIQDISDIEYPKDAENPRPSGNNYAMDTKSLEWDVVRLVAENFSLPPQPRLIEIKLNPEKYKDGYWGYVTSGGSESNMWGILEGFSKYPEGVLYFCEGAHYSISKAAKGRNCQIIPQISVDNEAIDVNVLIESIKTNWVTFKSPAILVLTFGTTKYGSTDDVQTIKNKLRELNIPHYIHIDAALYGGIPKNQKNAPKIGDYKEWGYDSICVSLHKYIGYPAAKGVLISVNRPNGKFIDYIGQEDNTVLGSRDVPAFSLRQQVLEVFKYTYPNMYIRNINKFYNILNEKNVKFNLLEKDDDKGNIFVFRVNKEVECYKEVCKRWQLSEFVGKDGLNRIHVVIFHTHSYEKLELLSEDISKISVN